MKFKKMLLGVGVILLFFSVNLVSEIDEVKCPKTVKVEVAKIAGQKFLEYQQFQSKVYPEMIAVKSLVSGNVTEVKVAEGDLVSKGLEMVVIGDALASEIKNLESELKKWKRILFERRNWKVRSEKAEQQAEIMIEETQKKLEEKKAAIPNYIIQAPVDGMIKSLKFEKGSEIAENDVVTEIVNEGTMLAAVPISPGNESLFSEGQEIPVWFEETEDKYEAVVVSISHDTVVLSIDNRFKGIKENYSLKFKILKREHEDAVVVANKNILADENGSFVYKLVGKYAKKTYLKIAAKTGEDSLAAEGLAIGDEIVVSEIVSAKDGTLRDEFLCVKDNAKVKVLVKDPETGKFVKEKAKRKAVKPEIKEEEKPVVEEKPEVEEEEPVVEEEPEVEEEVEKPAVKNVFTAGLGGGIFYVNQTSWSDIYSKANMVFGLKLGYQIKGRYEIFAEVDYTRSKGESDPIREEITNTTIPVYLGARYLFKTKKIFVPYVALAGIYGKLNEKIEAEEVGETAFGFSLQLGTYIDFTKNLSLDLLLKYDRLIFNYEEYDVKADMSGVRLLILVTYTFN